MEGEKDYSEKYILPSILELPGPPVNHNARGDDEVVDELSASLLKYQKKRCLDPTSSQPVYWSTAVLQRVAV